MIQNFASSDDGTKIAYEIHGADDAPTLVWVHGASQYRALSDAPGRLAALTGLRVLEFDRRGRGESGDAASYVLEREIEDVEALIQAVGGRASALLGESSGAVLALEAARAGVRADRVVAYEPPLVVDDSRPPLPGDYIARLDAAAAAQDPADAFRIFLTEAVGLPAEMAGGVQYAPDWGQLASVAHTLRYDARFMENLMRGDITSLNRYHPVEVPVLVGVGGDTFPFLRAGAEALVGVLPAGRLEVFPGGTHQTDPELIGPTVAAFVRGES